MCGTREAFGRFKSYVKGWVVVVGREGGGEAFGRKVGSGERRGRNVVGWERQREQRQRRLRLSTEGCRWEEERIQLWIDREADVEIYLWPEKKRGFKSCQLWVRVRHVTVISHSCSVYLPTSLFRLWCLWQISFIRRGECWLDGQLILIRQIAPSWDEHILYFQTKTWKKKGTHKGWVDGEFILVRQLDLWWDSSFSDQVVR